jgi:hypothetical protein
MDVRYATHKLGLVALFMVGVGTMNPAAWAASPTVISRCPYTITAPGSYILTKDLTSPGTCITISANTVVIDLHGHTITGDGTGQGITDGSGPGVVPGYIVMIGNGTIQNFETGIYMTSNVTVTDIIAQNNVSDGIVLSTGRDGIGEPGLPAFHSTVVYSRARGNGRDGIIIGGTVFASDASRNGGNGINATGPVISSTGNENGLDGIAAGGEGVVISSEAVGNGQYGIDITNSLFGVAADSIADHNTVGGIGLMCPATAASNTAVANSGGGNLVEMPRTTDCVNFNNKAP